MTMVYTFAPLTDKLALYIYCSLFAEILNMLVLVIKLRLCGLKSELERVQTVNPSVMFSRNLILIYISQNVESILFYPHIIVEQHYCKPTYFFFVIFTNPFFHYYIFSFHFYVRRHAINFYATTKDWLLFILRA